MTEVSRVRRANAVDVHVGGRVRMRRMLMGMSQEKVGEALGLTFQQVQKYEKGINRIGAGRLFELARILDVGVQHFFAGLAGPVGVGMEASDLVDQNGDHHLTEFLASPDGIRLNRAFLQVDNAKARRAILELVRSLADIQKKATSTH